MHPLSLAEYVQSVVSMITAGRLLQLGVARGQRGLLVYLIFISLFLLALATAEPASIVYFRIFVVGSALSWVVGLYAVRELFALTFDSYTGIRSAGRRVLYGAVALSSFVSILVTIFFGRQHRHGNTLLYFTMILDRSVVLTLTIVIVAVLLFLSRYPLHLSRNTYVSTEFFSAVFLSEAVVMLVDTLNAHLFLNWLDVAQVYFAALCFLGWAFMLTPEKIAETPRRIVFDNPQEHELLRQLDSLNQLLGRVGRR